MIIDTINSAGIATYLKDQSGNFNLSANTPSKAFTEKLSKGKQMNVSGIQFYLEADDLFPLFNFLEEDASGNFSKREKPLISLSVNKEILPGLFADPFKSRIHSIGGFQDLKRGIFENCEVFRLNNKPTLVSLGTETCSWKSIKYELPEEISIDHACWEIPSAKITPATAFKYSIKLYAYDAIGNMINGAPTILADNLNPTRPRCIKNIKLKRVKSYEVEFSAEVKHDSSLTERIVTEKADTIGRPILEGIFLLEPVPTKYDFYSLQEFLSECSEYELFNQQGSPIKRITATLNLSSVLVQSPNEDISVGEHEYLKLEIFISSINVLTAKIISNELIKVN